MRIILLGPPAAGKGTQAMSICQRFEVPQISTGDILRHEINIGSEIGKAAQEIMARGDLISDEIVIDLVKKRLTQADCENGFLLDGFPRTIAQAESLQKAGVTIDYVVDIQVPDQTIIERIAGRRVHLASGRSYHIDNNPPKVAGIDDVTGEAIIQRPDDSETIVKSRLENYHAQTKPLVVHYKKQAQTNNLHYCAVDGVGTLDAVTKRVFAALLS